MVTLTALSKPVPATSQTKTSFPFFLDCNKGPRCWALKDISLGAGSDSLADLSNSLSGNLEAASVQ